MLTGAVKRRQGKLDESIQLMQQAGLLDPRNNDVWVNLARSFRGARKFAEAHMMFDRALSVAPQQAAILAEKAETFAAAGDLESAERLLAPLPRDLSNEAFDDYLWVLELRRDFERERQMVSEALEKSSDAERRFWARGTLATLHLLQGGPDQAKPMLEELRRSTEEARAAGNESLPLRERLIWIASLLGDRETVERESAALLRQTSRDRWYWPVAEEITAAAFALLGDAESALPHLEKASSMPAFAVSRPFICVTIGGGTRSATTRASRGWRRSLIDSAGAASLTKEARRPGVGRPLASRADWGFFRAQIAQLGGIGIGVALCKLMFSEPVS